MPLPKAQYATSLNSTPIPYYTLISNPSFSPFTFTIAVSPVFSSPLMILSAILFPICLLINLFNGLAPNLGSYPRSASQSLTVSSTESVIRRSSSRPCSSLRRMSTISRRADVDNRLKIMNSSIRLRNSGASVDMLGHVGICYGNVFRLTVVIDDIHNRTANFWRNFSIRLFVVWV